MKVRTTLGGVNESEDNINKGEKKKATLFLRFSDGKDFFMQNALLGWLWRLPAATAQLP